MDVHLLCANKDSLKAIYYLFNSAHSVKTSHSLKTNGSMLYVFLYGNSNRVTKIDLQVFAILFDDTSLNVSEYNFKYLIRN